MVLLSLQRIVILYDRYWNAELEEASQKKKGSKKKPSLLRAMWNTFGSEFMFFGIFAFIEECGLR